MEFTTILLIIIICIALFIAYKIGRTNGAGRMDRYWQTELPNYRKDAVMRSRAVLKGHFSEQLAPYLPGFKYSPTECKFLGKPVDLIVFNGSDEKKIEEVVFLEIKTGKSKLNSQEKSLKETIEKGKVRYEEYRVDENLTKKED